MMSQIRDTIKVRARKHGMKLPRAQAAWHQAPEKHLRGTWWACILWREKDGGRPIQLVISKHSPSQTPKLPELVKAMYLKRLTIPGMLIRQPCGDKGLGRGRTHPCSNAKAHVWLPQPLQLPKISSQRSPVVLPFLCFLSLREVHESPNMPPPQLPHFLWHGPQRNTIMAT